MSIENIQHRLRSLLDTQNSQIQALINRLSNLKFPPGAIRLDTPEEDDVIAELSNEIQDSLIQQQDDLEILEQEVREIPTRKVIEKESVKASLLRQTTGMRTELKTLNTTFRKAQLAAKTSLSLSQRAERELLITSLSTPSSPSSSTLLPPRRKSPLQPLTDDEKAAAAASDITLALRRTHAMMASELSKSQFAHDTLMESTAALSQLSESYNMLDGLLAASKGLLGSLLKSQKSDTWYLETAFWILTATCAWLVWRRLLYGPTWWLVWLPLKVFYKAWMGVFAAVGLRGGREGGLASESLVVTTGLLSNSVAAAATMSGTGAPQVRMGGRDNAHPPIPEEEQRGGDGERGLVDEVGEMIDETRQQAEGEGQQDEGTVLRGRTAEDGPPNPKKRMWDESVEGRKQENREKENKDEL